MYVMLVVTVFLTCGGISSILHAAQAKVPETGTSDKDEKMHVVTVPTLGINETKHSDDKDAKAPLTCGKLGLELQTLWEEKGSDAFNDCMVQRFRGMPIKQAEELIAPISQKFLSKMSDEAITKIMVFGGILPLCLGCFQERLTQAIISRVVTLIITLCPLGALDMITCLATDQRTRRLITAEAINKPFKTGSLVRGDDADFATRLKILQLLCSKEATRNKVLPASLEQAEADLKTIIERH
jgi:hypothetical protein